VSLTASIRVRRGELLVELDLQVADGEVLAVLGPNGAGKSTLLRVLAGLLPPDAGRVSVGDAVWDDPGADVHRAPHERLVGMVFQDYLLFPHLSAVDNVAFGLRTRGIVRAEARQRAARWLDRVGLADLGDRRPDQLSGGQAQRTALARALATDPQLLLLDEPLAAIDADARPALRAQLAADLAAFAGVAVLVTHDVRDAEALTTRVVVLDEGRVEQEGTLDALRATPVSPVVARLVEFQTSSTSSGASG
jgi:molybdate transport system ATP-binding protein